MNPILARVIFTFCVNLLEVTVYLRYTRMSWNFDDIGDSDELATKNVGANIGIQRIRLSRHQPRERTARQDPRAARQTERRLSVARGGGARAAPPRFFDRDAKRAARDLNWNFRDGLARMAQVSRTTSCFSSFPISLVSFHNTICIHILSLLQAFLDQTLRWIPSFLRF